MKRTAAAMQSQSAIPAPAKPSVAQRKKERKQQRKQTVARNASDSAGVHTPAALFQTPHTPGPVHTSDSDVPLAHTQEDTAMTEGEREESAAQERYASPAPAGPADPRDRELREVRANLDRQSHKLEVRRVVRHDGELASLIAGTLCDGHAACAQLLMEHPFFPSLPSHIQLIASTTAAGHAQDFFGTVQKQGAQLGEMDAHVRGLKDQLAAITQGHKNLEREYANHQARINRWMLDKSSAVEGLQQTTDSMRLAGTPQQAMKQMLTDLKNELRAGSQQDLTSMETRLCTTGVGSRAASEEDEEEDDDQAEEGEATEQQPVQVPQYVPVQPTQQPSTSQPMQPVPPRQFAAVSGSQSFAKHMPKPKEYSGSTDVDEALFVFHSYLSATGADESAWPVIATPLLTGDAAKAWMATAMPLQQKGISPTWHDFCKSLRDAFAIPNKDLQARFQLRRVKQMDRSITEYVRRVRTLINSIKDKPSQHDQAVALFDGLNPVLQKQVSLNRQTNQFWASFDELADYLLSLETHTPAPATRTPVFGAKSPAKKPKLHALSAPQEKQGRKHVKFEQSGQQGGGRGGGGRSGGRGGKGNGGASKRQRQNQNQGAADPDYQAFLAWKRTQGN